MRGKGTLAFADPGMDFPFRTKIWEIHPCSLLTLAPVAVIKCHIYNKVTYKLVPQKMGTAANLKNFNLVTGTQLEEISKIDKV